MDSNEQPSPLVKEEPPEQPIWKRWFRRSSQQQWRPITFATEKRGFFAVLSLAAVLVLAAAVPVTVKLAGQNQDLRSAASGTALGSRLFCRGKRLCPDGKCEGESWYECYGCPSGKSRLVTEVKCDRYKKTQCYFECEED